MGVMLDVPMRLLLLIALGSTTLALMCVCVEWRPQVGLHTAIIDGVVLYDQYEFATPTVRTYVPSMVTAKDNTTSTKLRLRTLQTFVSFATVSTETPDSDEDVSAKIANNERDIQPTDEQRHALNCNPAPTLSSGVADVTNLTALAAASDAPTLARTLKRALTKIQVSTRPPDFSGYKSDHLQPKHGRTQSPPTATKFRNANGARSAQSNWHFRQISRHTRDGRQQHSQQAARLQSHHGFRSDSLNSRPKPSARTRQSTRTHPMAAEFATYWKFESFQDHDIEFRGALW